MPDFAFRTPPVELLGEIFLHCLPDKDTDRISPRNAPVVLCEVSSYWRQVAFSQRLLWDTVIFPSPESDNPSIEYDQAVRFIQTGGVERWFGRSGTEALLSFGEEGAPNHTTSLIAHFLPIVTKYARRLRHISLCIVKIRHFEYLRRGFPYSLFHNLESVSICCPLEMTNAQLNAFEYLHTPFKNECPKLTHASFTLLRAHPLRFGMAWSQLTSIQVDNHRNPLTVWEWAQLFRDCRNLQHATLVKPTIWGPGFSAVVDSEHQALTSLRFPIHGSFVGYPRWCILHRPVQFPNLRHLHFEFRNINAVDSIRKLDDASLARKRLPKLRSIMVTTPKEAPFEMPADVKGILEEIGPLVNA